jgi:beta-glucosidase
MARGPVEGLLPDDVTLPPGFLWGVASSAYQTEGALREDGRGVSIWDTFSHIPGRIRAGDTGDVACDHYHRWREDVALLAELGVGAYRFSIAWPRIIPEGAGGVNQAGLDFYDRLVDALVESNIQPFATLYHWDLPQSLEDAGGWPARATVDAFVGYAGAVTARLGDRVGWWTTVNEPRVAAKLGYRTGEHAPGRQDLSDSLAAAHHLLLAHGLTVPVIRANAPGAHVGVVLDLNAFVAGSSRAEDLVAARLADGDDNRWYLDPLAGRGYPDDVVRATGADLAFVREGDLETIAVPLDFLGVNYYRREVVSAGGLVEVPPMPRTEMGWEIYPQGISEMLNRLASDYPWPAYVITENGAAFPDSVDAGGEVQDQDRIEYLRSHAVAVLNAVDDGVPVRGYLIWSFLDNFEWTEGYSRRFGLVYVDFESQSRIPKASARWFGEVAKTGAP